MASHFSANQYDNAFVSRRLQNWQLPKTYKERPDSQEGFTQIISNDRGHLLEGIPRSRRSPWGEFVGTWDMPRNIPGNITSYVARSDPAVKEIKTQRLVHEKYMEDAKSPQKGLLESKASCSRTIPQTPPPTEVQDEVTRPGNPSPHSPTTKLSISPPKEDITTSPVSKTPEANDESQERVNEPMMA